LFTDYTTPSYNKEYNGSILSNISDLQLYGYSNTAFANLVNRKLTSSYIYKLVGGLVLYKLNKQLILIASTIEAEYIAMIYTAKEALSLNPLIWVLRLSIRD
jgi:hypothetical protein